MLPTTFPHAPTYGLGKHLALTVAALVFGSAAPYGAFPYRSVQIADFDGGVGFRAPGALLSALFCVRPIDSIPSKKVVAEEELYRLQGGGACAAFG